MMFISIVLWKEKHIFITLHLANNIYNFHNDLWCNELLMRVALCCRSLVTLQLTYSIYTSVEEQQLSTHLCLSFFFFWSFHFLRQISIFNNLFHKNRLSNIGHSFVYQHAHKGLLLFFSFFRTCVSHWHTSKQMPFISNCRFQVCHAFLCGWQACQRQKQNNKGSSQVLGFHIQASTLTLEGKKKKVRLEIEAVQNNKSAIFFLSSISYIMCHKTQIVHIYKFTSSVVISGKTTNISCILMVKTGLVNI